MNEKTVEIKVNDNGPLLVSAGAFILKDGSGIPYELGGRDMVALCRCGSSAKKPFCDGAHKQGFDSKCVAHTLPPAKPK